jgi:hypothetical protein
MIERADRARPVAMRAVLVAHLNHKRDVVIEQLRAAIVPPANSAKA